MAIVLATTLEQATAALFFVKPEMQESIAQEQLRKDLCPGRCRFVQQVRKVRRRNSRHDYRDSLSAT